MDPFKSEFMNTSPYLNRLMGIMLYDKEWTELLQKNYEFFIYEFSLTLEKQIQIIWLSLVLKEYITAVNRS